MNLVFIIINDRDFSKFIFDSIFKVDGDLTAGTFNSILTSGFILKEFNDFIIVEKDGKKTFTKELVLREGLTIVDTLNEYDLSVLWEEALKIEGDQTLRGFFVIENDVDIFRYKSLDIFEFILYSFLIVCQTRVC